MEVTTSGEVLCSKLCNFLKNVQMFQLVPGGVQLAAAGVGAQPGVEPPILNLVPEQMPPVAPWAVKVLAGPRTRSMRATGADCPLTTSVILTLA